MSEAIIVAIITSAVTLAGVLITNATNHAKITNQLETNQKLMEQKMEQMEADIREHNGYAKMFSENLPVINAELKRTNERLKLLEEKNK